MKFFSILAAALSVAFIAAAPAAAADTTAFNSTPTVPYAYGSGNGYSPANAAVTTTKYGYQVDARSHVYQQPAPASDGNGVYSFALGSIVNFDWGVTGVDPTGNSTELLNGSTALITLTNLLTNQTVSYNPFFAGNDNYNTGTTAQNSLRLNQLFLSALGFNENIDDTYKFNLSINDAPKLGGGTHSIDVYAKLGNGGGVGPGAVPEPATWAMMLVGFGAVGFSMRKRRTLNFASAV